MQVMFILVNIELPTEWYMGHAVYVTYILNTDLSFHCLLYKGRSYTMGIAWDKQRTQNKTE